MLVSAKMKSMLRIAGAIFGFWLAMLPCIVIAFAQRRLVKWLFWPAFGITAGGILLLSPGAPRYGEFANFEERGRRFKELALSADQ